MEALVYQSKVHLGQMLEKSNNKWNYQQLIHECEKIATYFECSKCEVVIVEIIAVITVVQQ